ncbi:MAG TPA: ABC-F family ATP-binding cassette domain-containing protein [Syntrophobacteraceae bacterium]|nr:ABC-F family ATP-binding cassette domain-containing protein [Syntrophobacteraceae bacterium]
MLAVNEVSKYLGKRELFRKVSLHIHPGERIGLIGANGSGKSTLFEILLGSIEPDSGNVTRTRGLRIGHLPQEVVPARGKSVLARATDVHEEAQELRTELESIQRDLDSETDRELLTSLATRQAIVLEKVEHLVGYDFEARAEKILEGLGFRTDQFGIPVSDLSGGWVMRLELGRLLLSEPELLLLDEPTNHLDLESLLWLEDYLLDCSSAFMVVSHDRAFLNKTIERIIEIQQGVLQEYAGGYDFYLEEKAKRMEVSLATYKNQQDRIRQLERFIDRNRYDKKTAGQAQSRIKMLEKMDKVEAPAVESQIHFSFPPPARSGKRVIELRKAGKSYGETNVYSGIDLIIERGDKIAFLGPNGAGKSTLLKMLAGVIEPSSGVRSAGFHTTAGYYAQHLWEQLNPDATVFEEALCVCGDMLQTQLRGLLGAFLFHGEDVLKKTAVLSGGEKARLVLCKLLLQRPNFLLLDEPTNHLDISSRVVVEKALGEFPGTICFISHDRRFINAVANKILVVKSGEIHVFPGNYDDYQQIWKARLEGARQGADEKPQRESSGQRSRTAQKRAEAEWRNELFRAKKPVQDLIESIERDLDACHAELERLRGMLADAETYRQGSLAVEILSRYREAQARIDELGGQWEAKVLELEQIEGDYRSRWTFTG